MDDHNTDEHVASTEFLGGAMRPVFQTPEGRQYVVDDDGKRVYGVWFILEDADRPVVVDDREL
jgi:hypothetical protein